MTTEERRCARELLCGAESNCCNALVWEQYVPSLRDKWYSTTLCDICERTCSVHSKPREKEASWPPSSTLLSGQFSDAQLMAFVVRFRKARPGVLLQDTVLLNIKRYNNKPQGEPCVSIRTTQQRCPLVKRVHGSNSVVLRFNLAQRTFSVACYCSPKPFFQCQMAEEHPDNCTCQSCWFSEVAEMYLH